MATQVGTSGVVKSGANAIGEITAFTLNQTMDTVEDTALTDSMKSYKVLRGDATATVECHFDNDDTAQELLVVGNTATLELYLIMFFCSSASLAFCICILYAVPLP